VRIGFERVGRDCVVEVAVNDDPGQLGCPGYARGFPYCRATISPPARGYADFLGWDFLAHSFLCGLGDDTLDGGGEIDAILGFSWGFRKRAGEVAIFGPAQLEPEDWDRHRDYLRETYPKWAFRAGFSGRAGGR
jgi:hypothetical protein